MKTELWPFTISLLESINETGFNVEKIEPHNVDFESYEDSSDYIWGLLTYGDEHSNGVFMEVDCEFGVYTYSFSTHYHHGGDTLNSEYKRVSHTENSVKLAAADFIKYFSIS